MSAGSIANRYARALFRICDKDQTKAQKFLEQLAPVRELFDLEDAGKVMRSPVMPADLKSQLFEYALGVSGAEGDLKNYMQGLNDARRLELFPSIMEAFTELLKDAQGLADAEIESAVPLENKELDEIGQSIGRVLDRTIRTSCKVNKDLLGGFVVKVGNFKVDYSLRQKLDQLTADQVMG